MTLLRPLPPFKLTTAHYVFAGVLLIRVIVLVRLTGSPFLVPTHGDMHFYNDWARRILAGQASEPLAFYGLPGYAYLLAWFYAIFGFNPFVPAFFQAALEAGTAVLIYELALRTFAGRGRFAVQSTGILAAACWAFFVPAQSYSVILMPTAWLVFAFWWVVWRLLKDPAAPAPRHSLLLGLVIGITATGVATILFLIPLVAAAIWLKPSDAHNHFRPLAFALLLVGVCSGTAPCWIHNYLFARDPALLSAHSGVNYWIGNNPDANGYPHFPPGIRAGQAAMLQDSISVAESAAGHPLKRSDVSRYWSSKAGDYILNQPLDWLRLIWLKFRNFWNAFQYDDLSVITNLREQGLTFPGIYFGIIATLAIPGIIMAWRTAPLSRWITSAIGLHLAALLPVFTTERYRLATVPGLLLFAAFGIILLWQSLAQSNPRITLSYATLLVGSILFVSWPQRDPSLWALDAYNSGWQALESGKLEIAEEKLQRARSYAPGNAETNFALGNLKLAQSDGRSAAIFYLIALGQDPQHRGALNNLGVLALQSGQPQIAEHRFRQALEIDSNNPKTHFLLAKSLFAQGENDRARAEVDCAVALAPNQKEFQLFAQSLATETP